MDFSEILAWVAGLGGGALGIAGLVVRFGLGPLGLIPFLGPALGKFAEALVAGAVKLSGLVFGILYWALAGFGRVLRKSWLVCCDHPITLWTVATALCVGWATGRIQPWVMDVWRTTEPPAITEPARPQPAAAQPTPTQLPDLFGLKRSAPAKKPKPRQADAPFDWIERNFRF